MFGLLNKSSNMKGFSITANWFWLFLISLPFQAWAQLFCGPGQFYAIGNSTTSAQSAVYRLQNSGGTITIPNLLTPIAALPNTNQLSLAIADFGDGKKLYSHYKIGAVNRVLRLDGTQWNVAFSDSSGDYTITNAAGYGSFLYYHASRTALWPGLIKRFTGNAMVTIWQDSVTSLPVGDIAVDSLGNVYFFSGAGSMVNQLNVISPTGAILDTMSISFNASNSYGCFFDNNTLYVAFGPNSTTYPNKLIPFSISPGQVVMGAPLNMPYPVLGSTPNSTIRLNMVDLASCGSANINIQGGGTTQVEDMLTKKDFQIYPIPAADFIQLKWEGNAKTEIRIMDVNGRIIDSWLNQINEILIPVSSYAPGLYVVEVKMGNAISRKKWLKS